MVARQGYVKWVLGGVTILMILALAMQAIPGQIQEGFTLLTGVIAVLAVMTVLVDITG